LTTARKRQGAYIWTTWIAPLLAGDAHCLWAVWFKAHYLYDKVSGFDGAKWHQEHASMVASSRDMLTSHGFQVYEEDQNKFALTRSGITLAGKPDLVAVKKDRVVVADCKSGCPHNAHGLQIMIYMAVLPCVRPHLKGLPIQGLLLYKDHDTVISADEVDAEFRTALRTAIHTVGATEPPAHVPSPQECRFCTISSDDCSDRIEIPEDAPISDHDLF
jgi:hypothetical protein